MNDFEAYLKEKIESVKNRRAKDKKEPLNETELTNLVLMEITYGELFIVLKNFPHADVNQILEKCIYIEARSKGYTPDKAFEEMKRQMEDRL